MAKIYLEWSDPWWARGKGGITLAWSRAEMASRALPRDWPMYASHFSEVAAHPNMLCCWISGSGARAADTLGEGEVVSELTALLRKFTGDPGLPRPKRLHRHAWSTDPLSLGSASYPILATDRAGSSHLEASIYDVRARFSAFLPPRPILSEFYLQGSHGTLKQTKSAATLLTC